MGNAKQAYCGQHVCMSVCLHVYRISQKPHVQILPVVVARSFSDGNAIFIYLLTQTKNPYNNQ